MERRAFLKQSAMTAAALTAASYNRILGANERIRVGFIGVGNRGSQLMLNFMDNADAEIAALCDVYKPYTSRDRSDVNKRWLSIGKVPRMGEKFPQKPEQYTDFRKMLEEKSIDAVCIATPDHWHAIQTIQSIDAGKDVFVEKPLTITINEGRAMVNAEKNSDRIVQVGLNRRGSSIYQNLAPKVQQGLIGKVLTARAYRISNMYPDGIGNLAPEEPPTDFDWDMWLGPRKFRPYQYNIAPYFFRWWQSYSSQMGNWGVHYMDVIRWLMGEQAPSAVTAHGGKYVLTDDRTIPDTMEVSFEFKSGAVVQFHIYEGTSGSGVPGGEVELNGTKGTLIASQNGYKINPAWPGQFQDWKQLVEPQEETLKSQAAHGDLNIKENSTGNLIRNFLDCVKSRKQPLCSLEDGHRSTTFAHLANISLEMGKRIEWDAENERITNSHDANKLLHYDYREPWTL